MPSYPLSNGGLPSYSKDPKLHRQPSFDLSLIHILLILDEATSALDNESEQHIQKSLEKLAKDRTTIVDVYKRQPKSLLQNHFLCSDSGSFLRNSV